MPTTLEASPPPRTPTASPRQAEGVTRVWISKPPPGRPRVPQPPSVPSLAITSRITFSAPASGRVARASSPAATVRSATTATAVVRVPSSGGVSPTRAPSPGAFDPADGKRGRSAMATGEPAPRRLPTTATASPPLAGGTASPRRGRGVSEPAPSAVGDMALAMSAVPRRTAPVCKGAPSVTRGSHGEAVRAPPSRTAATAAITGHPRTTAKPSPVSSPLASASPNGATPVTASQGSSGASTLPPTEPV